ncbi:SIS domain-containing protein [Arthrobacter psychrochitiniphilus]|uniref:MurR/RpiR family transcriptional regulator n=1 Tax=Arthrobacter psychrochitiniphilus TaxID=291045 RepID=A0A2V3DNG3_9MICC|nr:SIS domain-containing protein [Arthrobacter psychrochitiniphilus]NYG16083.1 DNA-binding MurR/RpiR family transcriptional regulator [Arthrobacter psychrochitiniphilus]PXA63956.1 MurR/RpiR family transcriptional regulator [Arthrobacter psychrochitiniphilus]
MTRHKVPYDLKVPLLEHIGNVFETLSKSERKVASLVLENPSFVVESTMAAVASAAAVSEPTVLRFATALGLTGFQQFKIQLAQTMALGLPATLSFVNESDSDARITQKLFDQTISSLDRTRRSLDIEQITKAADAILNARSILFAGLGASGIVAHDALQKSVLFGLPCSAPEDIHQQFMEASMATSDTVVIVISNVGRTLSVLDVAVAARSRGATVIAISRDDSPVTEASDIPLIVKTFEDTDQFTPTVSRLAHLVIIDCLATIVSIRRGSEHLARLAEMKRNLTVFRKTSSR